MTLADHTEFLESLGAVSIEAEIESFRIIRISSNVEEVLGYPIERCKELGFFLEELIHPDDVERVLSSITQAFENGRSETDFRAVHRNGSHVVFYAIFGSDTDPAETRFGGLFLRSDRSARSTRISEDRLQLALESAEMGVWEWSVTEANIYWSEELYRLHGCTPDEVGDLLENYTMLVERIHPDDFNTVQAIVINSLKTGDDYDVEYRFRMPDGSYRWLYIKGRMYVDDDQNPVRIAGTAQDVTARKLAEIAAARELEDRKRAEAELKKLTETLEQRVRARTDELEVANAKLQAEVTERTRAERELARANRRLTQSNRELQDFAYVASHDLKEPLRKIATFADLMRVDCDAELGEEGLFYIERMQESAGRMTSLINDLLDFSRVKTSGDPFSTIELNDVVDQVLSDLDVRIRESAASIHVDDLPSIDADPTQMRQLFQNLISNALKFRRDDTPPVISVRSLTTRTTGLDEEKTCRLLVEDNGIGFEEQYADRVFSPFQRLHKSYEGTGMGLAICRRIVERHHGMISVKSRTGHGTTFTIDLPFYQPKTDEDETE